MRNQTVRLFLYSSLAIVALTLVWGLRQIPRQGVLAEDQLRSSLEQELILLTSAVKTSTAALKYRLLDVLKAEGNEHSTRAFQDSPFAAATLLEWDGSQWKVLWHSSKMKADFQADSLRTWIQEWPLAKINGDEAFFAKVNEVEGQSYFALMVPVRKPNNTPMIGIGIFPAAQFGMSFAADHDREIRVFDNKGFALALAHPAYIGSSLKREPVVEEILDGDAVSLHEEWKSDRGIPMLGLAARLSDSNLFAAIETKTPLGRAWYVQAWLYLILCALGAVALNWVLFASLIRPLLEELAANEAITEKLRRRLEEQPFAPAPLPVAVVPDIAPDHDVIPSVQLPHADFVESAFADPLPQPETPAHVSLVKVVGAALRSLETRIREQNIGINKIGLDGVEIEGDILQLQTAIEEVLKNAVESMSEAPTRQLTISAQRIGGRISLIVEDTGCGIEAANLKKVFDPFYSTKDSQGVARGLGLNVVRRVVEELQGSVQVVNRQGEPGVRVEIEWPLHKSTVQEAPLPSEAKNPDLDFLDDRLAETEEFDSSPVVAARHWPTDVAIRKPKVRTLD